MSDQNKYRTEKMGEAEKKKKADLERRTGVPDPAVPNRAHTEMSHHHDTKSAHSPFGPSPFYVDTKSRRDTERDIRKRMDKE